MDGPCTVSADCCPRLGSRQYCRAGDYGRLATLASYFRRFTCREYASLHNGAIRQGHCSLHYDCLASAAEATSSPSCSLSCLSLRDGEGGHCCWRCRSLGAGVIDSWICQCVVLVSLLLLLHMFAFALTLVLQEWIQK